MSVGKTREFATSIINYIVSGGSLPTHGGSNQLYIAIVSGNPYPGIGEPFTASSLSAVEVSAGNFRAQITSTNMDVTSVDSSAVKIANDNGAIDFPSTAPADFNMSGYVLCLSPTSTQASAYLGYEIFEGSTASKQRSISSGDTLKVNTSNLILRER